MYKYKIQKLSRNSNKLRDKYRQANCKRISGKCQTRPGSIFSKLGAIPENSREIQLGGRLVEILRLSEKRYTK